MASHLTAGLIKGWMNLESEIHGKRILEVGSSTWPWESIRERFAGCTEFISVDIKQRHDTDIICDACDLVKLFGPQSFDFIVSLFTIEHVKDWKRAISNIKNVCKPGGVIFISTVTQPFPYHDEYDAWRYEIQDLCTIFSDCHIEATLTASIPDDDSHAFQIFMKAVKPLKFTEVNLSRHKLYDINKRKRI